MFRRSTPARASRRARLGPRGFHRPGAQAPGLDVLALWFESLSPATASAYRVDVADFETAVGRSPKTLPTASQPEANACALAWRSSMLRRQLSPATVNRRLAALRSFLAFVKAIGFDCPEITTKGVKSSPYRDTKGPPPEALAKLTGQASERHDAKGKRDRAILEALSGLALRRGEMLSVDLGDVDLDRRTLRVVRKGRTEPESIAIPETVASALAEWIEARGREAGPLFLGLHRDGRRGRLTGSGLYDVLQRLGKAAGLDRLRPHGLRHAAITAALDLTGGDVRAVQRFSGHRNVATVLLYDDASKGLAGDIARRLADARSSFSKTTERKPAETCTAV